MELIYFTKTEDLDDFILSAAVDGGAEFLQSWRWGELLLTENSKLMRVGVRKEGEILAAATIVKNYLAGAYSYWYAPRGPIFKSGLSSEAKIEIENFLFSAIKGLDSRAVFFRIEPGENITASDFRLKKSRDLQPRQTLLLDLAASDAELLKDMHQKTRYNINLAVKKGVVIKEGTIKDIPEFWRLMSLTGERDNFRLHGEAHYQNLLKGQTGFIKLYFAVYEGKNIAAGLFCFWGDKVTYLHGASDNEFRNVMAPFLLQWELISRAKQDGYKYYDFYGIDAAKWPGVTRFKLGFGGRKAAYLGTYDVIFRSGIYYGYELIRRIRHGRR